MVKDLCFEIIEKCPNNCIFCSSNSCIEKKNIIKYEDFKRVIDYFLNNGGIEELSLSGGEPFLHPDLLRMVTYAKNNGIRTVIFTSGVKNREKMSTEEIQFYEEKKKQDIKEVLEHEPWNERLIKNIEQYYNNILNPSKFSEISKDDLIKLKESGLDKIVFDYQGYEDETDHLLMGRNESSRVAALNSIFYASIVGLNVDIHFIPMKPNYKEIKDILELIELVKIKNISLLKFVPQGRGSKSKEKLQLNEEEKIEFFELLNRSSAVYSGNVRRGIPLQGDTTHKCNAGLEKLDIKFDGTVLPCPAFKELTQEECKKYGIKLYNIYEDLEQVKIRGVGTRNEPLCNKVYKKFK